MAGGQAGGGAGGFDFSGFTWDTGSTAPGGGSSFRDIFSDLFGGSGSTLIAAQKTGRRAYLCELDPLYCDVIVERWRAFTGKEPARG